MRRLLTPRIAGPVALGLALVVILLVLLGPGRGGYEVVARFKDAGQLVKGGNVQVAGGKVGSIKEIRLGDDGIAEVVLGVSEDVAPLHAGTTAEIRSLGLSGVANRYVDLKPGPASGSEIDDGGRLQLTQTAGIVDLDQVLTSLDERTRKNLQGLVKSGGQLFAGDAAQDSNRAIQYLNPALSETRALAQELTRDRDALSTLIRDGATTGRVLATHDAALRRGLTATATTLSAVADERRSLDATLSRGPDAARQTTRALDRIGQSFDVARPALRELADASPALSALVRQLPPTTQTLRPVLADLRQTVPPLNTALRRLPAVAADARPALRSATSAVLRLQPIAEGLRPYAPDLVAGVFLGFGGTAGPTYDANGHVGRISIASVGAGAPGVFATLFPDGSFGTLTPKTGLVARCPGAGAQTAPDGSNGTPANLSFCNPDQRRP